ncbi:hypothetical protein [Paraburkholderia strydomiana]|uniref:hypothetical protein n=1 Tax=Paraburkholderia strydomiana TaxID=1245417 RepID=UPI001BECC0FA|nr:hypothetical protein [Paraburkholderia strydomiana]MBT2791950.1 hypothetical protein [Paraburkholderia strydomiana]
MRTITLSVLSNDAFSASVVDAIKGMRLPPTANVSPAPPKKAASPRIPTSSVGLPPISVET